MDFLIRFVQVHEQFRQAEIEALGTIAGVLVEVISYSNKVRLTPDSPHCNVTAHYHMFLTIYSVTILHSPLSFFDSS
jgi:tRNA G10  N-methylase Trm11